MGVLLFPFQVALADVGVQLLLSTYVQSSKQASRQDARNRSQGKGQSKPRRLGGMLLKEQQPTCSSLYLQQCFRRSRLGRVFKTASGATGRYVTSWRCLLTSNPLLGTMELWFFVLVLGTTGLSTAFRDAARHVISTGASAHRCGYPGRRSSRV